MTLIGLLILLIVIGVFLHFFPLDATIRQIIYAILALLVVLIILSLFGLIPMPHLVK
jgi:hypothetical protein